MLRCCRPAVATLLPLLPAAAPVLLLLSQPTQVRFPCAPWFALLCRNRVIVVDSSSEIAGNRVIALPDAPPLCELWQQLP